MESIGGRRDWKDVRQLMTCRGQPTGTAHVLVARVGVQQSVQERPTVTDHLGSKGRTG